MTFTVFYYRVKSYKKLWRTALITQQNTNSQYSTSSDVATETATNTANQTTIVGGNEIALPGYLHVQDDEVDKSKKPLASGGGGTIYVGQFLNYGIGARRIREGVKVCVVKQVKQTEAAVFYQEVASMYYFRNTPRIIELYGYNGESMTVLLPFYERGSL